MNSVCRAGAIPDHHVQTIYIGGGRASELVRDLDRSLWRLNTVRANAPSLNSREVYKTWEISGKLMKLEGFA